METSQLAHRIRAFRKLKGYTQQQLASELGVSLAILGSIERGTRVPSEKIIEDISNVLKIDKDEILENTN